MARPYDDEDEDKPLDPAVERVRRKLVRFVAINLGLLFLALMAVVVAIVYRASQTPDDAREVAAGVPAPAPGQSLDGEIALPAGTRIARHAISGTLLSLETQGADGARAIILYDIAERRVMGRIALVEGGGD